MRNQRVLISGAGVAGPTLAYWLLHYGFEPTLIERAPTLRTGGYIIDFWGLGFDVAEKMGLLPALKERGYKIDEVRILNGQGERVGGFDMRSMESIMKGRYVSILRSDLARLIYDTLGNRIKTIFGDSITAVESSGAGARVSFENAADEHYDLVIGAGGLHSPVRQIAFGPDATFERYLGYYAASFAVDHYPHNDPRTYVTYAAPGHQVSRYALRDDRTVFFFVFAEDAKLSVSHRDIQGQKQIIRNVYANDKWECPEILKKLDECTELYFDSVSQIRMDHWSNDRITLLGDACSCPSLLAGQGAALAMAGAYILAGELHRAAGDYDVAFRRYEERFHPFTSAKQDSAEGFARSFAPKTPFRLFLRNKLTRLLSIPFAADLMIGRMLTDSLELPNYESA